MQIQPSNLIVTLKGKNAVAVASIDDAVKVCAQYRDTADYGSMIGATEYYNGRAGRVIQGKTKIAQIHYNGRIELAA